MNARHTFFLQAFTNRTIIIALAMLPLLPAAGVADPVDRQIPVSVTVNTKVAGVGGRYWFRWALFDRDGSDPGDPVVWAEEMDTSGPRRKLTSRRLSHALGSLWRGNPANTPLDPADFEQQLWVQAFRRRNGHWVACSVRTKLKVAPYALRAESVGPGSVGPGQIADGAALAEILDDDGTGSGLDADLLDGQHAAYFSNAENLTGVLPVVTGGTGSGTAAGARANLGAASTTHAHDFDQITGTLGTAQLSGTYNASIAGNAATATTATTAADADRLDGRHAVEFAPSGHGHREVWQSVLRLGDTPFFQAGSDARDAAADLPGTAAPRFRTDETFNFFPFVRSLLPRSTPRRIVSARYFLMDLDPAGPEFTGSVTLALETRDFASALAHDVLLAPVDLLVAPVETWTAVTPSPHPADAILAPGEYLTAHFAAAAGSNVSSYRVLFQVEVEEAVACTANAGCTAVEYCGKAAGACLQAGTCEPVPGACPFFSDPVCGCDGSTYDNDCLAAQAGVSLDHFGPCP